jgi:hypothetical protein
LLIGGHGQFVATVVFRMAAVPGNAHIGQCMACGQLVEHAPQVFVLDLWIFSTCHLPFTALVLEH